MDSRKAFEFSQEKTVEAVKTSPTVETFETEYPELSTEFKAVQQEMYELFARKQMDYGLSNIALGGDLKNKEDKNFSLTGLAIRLTDKVSRLRNLIKSGKNYVYCKILRNCGWTLSKIGESINRDHASMIHYLKRFENEVGQNENADIMINYKKVSNSFNRYLNKNYLSIMTRSELEQTIEKLLKDEKYI